MQNMAGVALASPFHTTRPGAPTAGHTLPPESGRLTHSTHPLSNRPVTALLKRPFPKATVQEEELGRKSIAGAFS